MTAFNDLTDAELRRQLKHYGEIPGPITETTRAIYIKKLKNLKGVEVTASVKTSKSMKNASKLFPQTSRKSASAKSSAHVLGFSSDDSENEGVKLRKKGSTANLQRKRKAASANQDIRKSVSSPINTLHSSTAGISSASNSPKITNGYSDDSDDEMDSSQGSWVQMTSAVTNTSPGLLSGGWNSSNSMVTRRRSLRTHSSPHNDKFSQAGFPSPLNSVNTDTTSDDVGYSTSRSINSGVTKDPKVFQRELRNGGDCYRRKAFSNTADKKRYQKDLSEGTKEQTSAKSTSSRNIFARLKNVFGSKENEQLSSDFKQSKEPAPRSWSLLFTYLLPACVFIFFITLGLLYVTMRTDDMAPPMLQDSVQISNQLTILSLVNGVYEILATRTGNNICEESEESNLVSLNEIRSHPQLQMDQSTLLKVLQLIRDHPEWKIYLYKEEQSLLQDNDSVSETRYLETSSAMLPNLCRFRRAFQKVLYWVFVVVAACLSLWLMFVYRQYRLRKFEEERQAMFTLISKILDVLRKNHESSLEDDNVEPFLPIIHVRDMIVPPADRRKMSKVWEMAVRFISASESRVRVETQRVSGEDFTVWRWIQVTSPGKRKQTPGRVWQGGAFPTNQSINTPDISPTPCLKIRNLFDPDFETADNWHLEIQDSILEKCPENNDFLSIMVEKESKEGLVYVKCGSRDGAGKAFRSLHGAWFDGRLVTVKFIKLQRFHTRYPDTVDLITPLKKHFLTPISSFSAPDSVPTSGFFTSTPSKSA